MIKCPNCNLLVEEASYNFDKVNNTFNCPICGFKIAILNYPSF
jgi:predicted RNA-binding Zn-ribbon protein involved in translation (DUF1610 family)